MTNWINDRHEVLEIHHEENLFYIVISPAGKALGFVAGYAVNAFAIPGTVAKLR